MTKNGKFLYLMWYRKENTKIYQNHNFLWYRIINKHKGLVAQLVERKALNLVVLGSSSHWSILFIYYYCYKIGLMTQTCPQTHIEMQAQQRLRPWSENPWVELHCLIEAKVPLSANMG